MWPAGLAVRRCLSQNSEITQGDLPSTDANMQNPTAPPCHPGAQRLEALECLRGFAAVYVVAAHVCNVYLHNPAWALPFRFASEVVIVFFLLSGFLVRYATRDDVKFKEFFVKRAKRIYPLFCVSLAFSYLCASVVEGAPAAANWPTLIGNLLMLQDFGFMRPGVWVHQYYNEALWSLAYEWWFYGGFIALLSFIDSPRIRNVVVISAAAGAMVVHAWAPNQLGYFVVNFLIWWSAAEVARHYKATHRIQVRTVYSWAAVLCAFGLLWLPALFALPSAMQSPGLYPILDMRRFFAGAFILIIGCFWHARWHAGGELVFNWTFGPFRFFARTSYGIYIFHFPIILVCANSSLANHPALCVAVIAAATLSIAYLMETHVQPWANGWKIWRDVAGGQGVRKAPAANPSQEALRS